MTSMIQRSIKLVAVGDGAVGKTCMLMSFAEGKMPEEYIPTVFENHALSYVIDGEAITMNLWDTAGQEEYERLRSISYPDTHLFLLCFSIVQPASFENVSEKWHPEITHHSRAPFMLVGTKTDLRFNEEMISALAKKDKEPVTFSQGASLARRIGAVRYMECSALSQEGLQEIFREAAKIALDGPPDQHGGAKKKNMFKCQIL